MPKSFKEFRSETSFNPDCTVIRFYAQSADGRVTTQTPDGACVGLAASWICNAAKHGRTDATYFWRKNFGQRGEDQSLPKSVGRVMKMQDDLKYPLLAPVKYLKKKEYLEYVLEGSITGEPTDVDVMCKSLEIQNTVSLIMLMNEKGNHALGCAHVRSDAFQLFDPNIGDVEFYRIEDANKWLKALVSLYAERGKIFDMYVPVFKVKSLC